MFDQTLVEHLYVIMVYWLPAGDLPFFVFVSHKLNSLLTYYQQGFITQLVEHHTGNISIMEVMGLNPTEASDFFLSFLNATALVAS